MMGKSKWMQLKSNFQERQRQRDNELARQLYLDGAPTFDEAAGLPPLTDAEIEQQDRDIAATAADYDRLIAEGFDLTTGAPKVDPGPSAVDRGQGRLKTFTEGWDPPNHSAVDRGPGPEFSRVVKDVDGHDMVLTGEEPLTAPLGPGAYIGPTEVTLKPEVLAQLQRIEDMLNKILEEGVPSRFTIRNKSSDHQHG